MKLNYQKICQDLLKNLPTRTKDILEQRFGLKTGERETLEAIGKNYGITRERVRQIEADGLSRIKPELEKYQGIFEDFSDYLRGFGGLRKEDILLSSLGGKDFQSHVYFLLNLGKKFDRFSENQDFYSLWTTNPKSLDLAAQVINLLYNRLSEINRPLDLKEISQEINSKFKESLSFKILQSFIEISKKIQPGIDGQFGLRDWPQVSPRGVKDRAYFIFQKENRPLHFEKITKLINSSEFKKISHPEALVQTVHNELIKDPRFVLVGRGLYALAEWGYFPGTVEDTISKILEEENRPLTKEEIVEKVLEQRVVKVNTILINLNRFKRTPEGRYVLEKSRLG